MQRFMIACGAALALVSAARAERVVWPLPPCSPRDVAMASPAPMASNTSSLRAMPFVVAIRPPSVAFVAGLDEANRPQLECYIAERSDIRLVAVGSVAAAGLALSTPKSPNPAGRYVLRLWANFGMSWMTPPPPDPLIPRCVNLADDEPRAAIPFAPKPVHRVAPKYPVSALREEIEGEAVVLLDIFSNGEASPACIDTGTPPGWFEQAALDAVAQWRFAQRDTMGRYRVTVKFRME